MCRASPKERKGPHREALSTIVDRYTVDLGSESAGPRHLDSRRGDRGVSDWGRISGPLGTKKTRSMAICCTAFCLANCLAKYGPFATRSGSFSRQRRENGTDQAVHGPYFAGQNVAQHVVMVRVFLDLPPGALTQPQVPKRGPRRAGFVQLGKAEITCKNMKAYDVKITCCWHSKPVRP
jgi:hypothetical protein